MSEGGRGAEAHEPRRREDGPFRAHDEPAIGAVNPHHLEAVISALMRALTPTQVAAAVVREGLPLIRADAGAILLAIWESRRIRLVGAAGFRESTLHDWGDIPLDTDYPVSLCIRTGESVWLRDREERARRFPALEAADPLTRNQAWAAIPLTVRERPLGALALSFREPREFTADERTLMALLAQQCAQALERARLYDAERQARVIAEFAERRVAFLAEASSRLGASLDYRATLENLTQLVVPEFADWVTVRVLGHDPEAYTLVSLHRDEALAARLAAWELTHSPRRGDPGCVAAALFDGRRELMTQAPPQLPDREGLDAEHASLLRALDTRSRICVPVRARNRNLGALVFGVSTGGRRYTSTDLALAEDLALRVGQAVDNAHLYENAVQASDAKSDFLAVMSHELRTPLNAILGYADLMLLGIPQPVGEQTRRQVERVQAAGGRLLRMVDEVLSFARLEAGREVVRVEPTLLLEVLEDTLALVEPIATAKGLQVSLHVPRPSPVLHTDSWKLRHVVANLLSNAVKFTDRGAVTVEASVENSRVTLCIRDTGIGIPAEHLERIFEPFWQVDRSATRRFEGTGLGLGVAREMARLLGGEIDVDSAVGRGSEFRVHLPIIHPDRV